MTSLKNLYEQWYSLIKFNVSAMRGSSSTKSIFKCLPHATENFVISFCIGPSGPRSAVRSEGNINFGIVPS